MLESVAKPLDQIVEPARGSANGHRRCSTRTRSQRARLAAADRYEHEQRHAVAGGDREEGRSRSDQRDHPGGHGGGHEAHEAHARGVQRDGVHQPLPARHLGDDRLARRDRERDHGALQQRDDEEVLDEQQIEQQERRNE